MFVLIHGFQRVQTRHLTHVPQHSITGRLRGTSCSLYNWSQGPFPGTYLHQLSPTS